SRARSDRSSVHQRPPRPRRPALPWCRDETYTPPALRCGAAGYRCAARSIRPTCRSGWPAPHWSESAPADRTHSRARPNALQSRESPLSGGGRKGQRPAFAMKCLVDLGRETVAANLIANTHRRRKANGIGAAVAFDDNAVQSEEDTAVDLPRIHLVA